MENSKQSQMVSSSEGTSELVKLISDKLSAVGLLSYTTKCKVHWAANVSTFCVFTASTFLLITVFMAKEDPNRRFDCLSLVAFCSIGMYKVTSLRRNHRQWRYLLDQISNLEYEEINNLFTSDAEYQSEDEDSNIFSKYVQNYTQRFKNTTRILLRIYGFTCTLFITSPILEYMVWKVRGVENLEKPHILPEVAPLDFHIIGYVLTVICEIVSSAYCVAFHSAFDLTAVGIMIFICGQFSLLRDYCARIAGDGKNCIISKKINDRASFRIKHCHRINMILIDSVSKLDKLLKNIMGLYFFLATVSLCSVAIRLNYSADMTKMQLITLLQYMCGTVTQLFLFCYYGDAVLNESAVNMGQGPFASAYWCVSPRIRRDLTLLSMSMITPRHLRAGPFNYIDLPSFITVIRAAYSYYAVLGQTN